MKVISKRFVDPIADTCCEIRELLMDQDISFSIASIEGKTIPHKHNRTKELYYLAKGSGEITINNESRLVTEGDFIEIPIGEFHAIKQTSEESLEIIVVCIPCFDPKDVIVQ